MKKLSLVLAVLFLGGFFSLPGSESPAFALGYKTPVPTHTKTATPTATNTKTATPTLTATPTATATATNTITPIPVAFQGTVIIPAGATPTPAFIVPTPGVLSANSKIHLIKRGVDAWQGVIFTGICDAGSCTVNAQSSGPVTADYIITR